MKQSILFVLCTLLTTLCVADKYQLKQQMWGTKGYRLLCNNDRPLQLTPLTPEIVSTPFFVSLKNMPQAIKDEILLISSLVPHGDPAYFTRRRNMAAAKIAGAHVPTVQKNAPEGELDLLSQAVMFQDKHLLKLMLDCADVDVHEINSSLQYTPIHYAEQASIARQLIKRGALKDPTKIKGLLHRIAMPQYVPQLITLYKDNGINPLTCDKDNRTFLMLLTHYPHQNMFEKAALLLDNLPSEAIVKLLATQDMQGRTVFSYIWQQLERHKCYTANLHKLEQFLLQKYALNRSLCKTKLFTQCGAPCYY